jgi:hypothetical protein
VGPPEIGREHRDVREAPPAPIELEGLAVEQDVADDGRVLVPARQLVVEHEPEVPLARSEARGVPVDEPQPFRGGDEVRAVRLAVRDDARVGSLEHACGVLVVRSEPPVKVVGGRRKRRARRVRVRTALPRNVECRERIQQHRPRRNRQLVALRKVANVLALDVEAPDELGNASSLVLRLVGAPRGRRSVDERRDADRVALGEPPDRSAFVVGDRREHELEPAAS